MTRNSKHTPEVGDILMRWGSTRIVTGIERNDRGTITCVTYNDTERITIGAWRAWAKTDASIVAVAGEEKGG